MGLFDSIGSAIGVSGGGLFTGLTSLAGGILSNLTASSNADKQMAFQREMADTQYQRAVEDMKAAGINPMLAAKVGGNAAPAGAMAPVQDVLTPAMNSARQADLIQAQIGNIDADSASKRADMYLKMAQEKATLASAGQSASQTNVNELNAERISRELANIPKEGDRLDATVRMLAEQAKLMKEQGKSQQYIQVQTQAMANKLMSETALLDFDIKAVADSANFARVVRQYGPFAEMILSVLKYMKPSGGITINR